MSTLAPNPYAAPDVDRQLPTLHCREHLSAEILTRERELLAEHCSSYDQVARDRTWALPRFQGLALTLASLGATAFVVGCGIAALALILERDRSLLLSLAGICTVLAAVLGFSARTRLRGDHLHADDDRQDPVMTVRAYLQALSHGHGGEIVCRLSPGGRAILAEAPDICPHRSRAIFPMGDPEAALTWAKTFARSDPVQPRWMMVREVELEGVHEDLALVRIRIEFRWWALWGIVLVGSVFLPLLFFALIPGLLLYLALMQRRVVVITKHVLRGPDHRWYLVRPNLVDAP